MPHFPPGEAESLSRWLLEELFSKNWIGLLSIKKEDVSRSHLDKMNSWIGELEQGRPWQYITGHAAFFGYDFLVNEAVLIPRQETEELVDLLIRHEKKRGEISILDLGTGSGCIAISLARKLEDARVSACDISVDALEVASGNAGRLSAPVLFFEADMLRPAQIPGTYDVLVSNPPYIAEHESAGMEERVTGHEPHTALFVPDEDPLRFYQAIATLARTKLNPGGAVYVEINERFGKETAACFSAAGFSEVTLILDMQNKDRLIRATSLSL
ncbi:MAG: peptide chain release factor N(5)-glutamine methyltransferase [Mucilaginibacter polytrichastri]|nr:peptide chain release factor N(5)-glutamine methyltransferase [Mucilaginibacter polytrichastri]